VTTREGIARDAKLNKNSKSKTARDRFNRVRDTFAAASVSRRSNDLTASRPSHDDDHSRATTRAIKVRACS
jgi:hypothetical protein